MSEVIGAAASAGSGAQLRATLAAAAVDDCPSGLGAHASTESVLLGATAVVGLVGALHGKTFMGGLMHTRRSVTNLGSALDGGGVDTRRCRQIAVQAYCTSAGSDNLARPCTSADEPPGQ